MPGSGPLSRHASALVACALALAPATAGAGRLVFNTEESPPFNYFQDGKVVGTSADIVRRIAKDADIAYDIIVGPWKKSYNNALHQDGHCVFSTKFTEARAPLFKWVMPIEISKSVIYKRKGDPFKALSLEDLRGKKIGSYSNDIWVGYLRDANIEVEEANSDYVNMNKLKTGRIDLWAGGEGDDLVAREAGIEVEEALVFAENVIGLACNKKIDDHIIERLQEALDQLNASGEAEEIRRSRYQTPVP
ncbi:ABC transporter substrate-binding protein [Haematospirillum sp. 15-248]|uniref:substrate-binding periplasmic protein n=1 Tax=Haematospirillum sp. 15-248 TaxID=2723107 RepID=UPI00143BDBD3|nr:ABC transporter substrate-binding protein [Haematospirillum sp. 15-248]NKD87413.1 ABC transporter substrate-binding protein [Haematospirillum sp. 15-248]